MQKQQLTWRNESDALRPQNVLNDFRHKRKLAVEDQSKSFVLRSLENQWGTTLFRGYHMFLYRPVYQAWASITARGYVAKGSCRRRLDIGPIWKHRVITSLSYDRTICQRTNYFICHHSLLEYAENNWWMIDRLLPCYTELALAATTNQRRPSLSMTYRNSKLSYTLYGSARTDISPVNFHL